MFVRGKMLLALAVLALGVPIDLPPFNEATSGARIPGVMSIGGGSRAAQATSQPAR